jgi:hypothetical protein
MTSLRTSDRAAAIRHDDGMTSLRTSDLHHAEAHS